MSVGGVLLKGADAGATVLGLYDQDLQTYHNIRSHCLLLHNLSVKGGELVHDFRVVQCYFSLCHIQYPAPRRQQIKDQFT